MGTINRRQRADGSWSYTAQIVIKRGGKTVHSEAQTFSREPAARQWMKRREEAIKRDGFQRSSGTLGDAIDEYLKGSVKSIGKTKRQVLNTIKTKPIADMRCADIRSADLVKFAAELGETVKPQTVGNYMSHLSSVFAVAKSAWNMDLDRQEMQLALEACKRLGSVSKPKQRTRRPTIDEIDRLMTYFQERRRIRRTVPMHHIVAFAIFSTRRQEEIVRMRWADLEPGRILIRDMKDPSAKEGNHVWCDLPPEAMRLIEQQPRTSDRIWPYTTDAVSANFTRDCKFLEIEDLHFHDLRHEGISRLFEMGWTIPHVAAVSGHRSWQSLQRYTHIRQTGDRWSAWPWLDKLAPPKDESEP